MGGATTCPYCGVGCGMVANGSREVLSISGDVSHPANAGKLCSKGSALGETVGLEGRLLHPMIMGRRASWEQAIARVADAFAGAIATHGPDAVALYVSGQILTEDYYLANKFAKGFLGTANIDTNSRLCMASAVVAHKKAFGEDVVPCCYEDLDLADLIVFSGHNAAWTHPVLYRRMEAQLERGQRHIVIDPRRTDTAAVAHLHLAIKPQTDIRLWNGLAAYLIEKGALDKAYIASRTNGFADLQRALNADDQSLSAIARDCDLSENDVATFYADFAATPRTVTLFSQGSNQSTQGVDKGLAVINAHLMTGRVSQPGASPFSITGQPNAMGGRETGGLATTLAAHLDFTPKDCDTLGRFWGSAEVPTAPGLKAMDMFEAIRAGKIKALWVIATNPVLSLPNASLIEEAVETCPFVAVSEVMANTETTARAHVLLPAVAWGEKDGTVTNSERCISRQRAVLNTPDEARPDWQIIQDVAVAMGASTGFRHQSPASVFGEYAALTNFENDGSRMLKLGPLADLTEGQYDDLKPVLWPLDDKGKSDPRPFANRPFPTSDGRARLIPVVARPPANPLTPQFPFALNTGRLRDQWHTMTRTGLSPRLMRHAPEPLVDVHLSDGEKLGLDDGDLARVTTAFGSALFGVKLSTDVRKGDLFVPMHWGERFASDARANVLTSPSVDAASGQPEFKYTPARLDIEPIIWRGFLVARDEIVLPKGLIWRRTTQDNGHLYEISAGPSAPDIVAIVEALRQGRQGEVIELQDAKGQFARLAVIAEDQLVLMFAATKGRGLPHRAWLVDQLGRTLADDDRFMLLAGGPVTSGPASPCVCACFNVSEASIAAFAVAQPTCTVADVGSHLKAGTNCGSCRTQIKAILAAQQAIQEVSHDG